MYQVFGKNGSLVADAMTVEWKYYNPAEADTKKLHINTLETDGRLPVYCSEKLDFYYEKIELPDSSITFDDWGTRYYCNIYNAITKGTPVEVQLSQVRRQIAIIEECHKQNPLPVTINIPEGTF